MGALGGSKSRWDPCAAVLEPATRVIHDFSIKRDSNGPVAGLKGGALASTTAWMCAVLWYGCRGRRALACPSSRIKAGVKANAEVYYDTVAANMDLGSALGREMRSKRGRGMRARGRACECVVRVVRVHARSRLAEIQSRGLASSSFPAPVPYQLHCCHTQLLLLRQRQGDRDRAACRISRPLFLVRAIRSCAARAAAASDARRAPSCCGCAAARSNALPSRRFH